jgi:hypothetical protein
MFVWLGLRGPCRADPDALFSKVALSTALGHTASPWPDARAFARHEHSPHTVGSTRASSFPDKAATPMLPQDILLGLTEPSRQKKVAPW